MKRSFSTNICHRHSSTGHPLQSSHYIRYSYIHTCSDLRTLATNQCTYHMRIHFQVLQRDLMLGGIIILHFCDNPVTNYSLRDRRAASTERPPPCLEMNGLHTKKLNTLCFTHAQPNFHHYELSITLHSSISTKHTQSNTFPLVATHKSLNFTSRRKPQHPIDPNS